MSQYFVYSARRKRAYFPQSIAQLLRYPSTLAPMPANRVTLKDIAQQTGLSTATISRALADHPDISTETKTRVRDAAQAMSYIPNYRARYLRAKHSRLIALIVPEMNMFFVPSMIAGINRVVQQNDYSLIVFQSDNSIVQERRLAEYASHLSADGVLLVLSSETSDLQHLDVLHDCGIPVALLDRTIETTKYTTITIDDEEAGREAASYLMDRGHTRIVGVFGDQRQRISSMRLRGFRRAHAERVAAARRVADHPHHDDRTTSRRSSSAPSPSIPDISAIFTMTDDLLVHTHHLLARRGSRIPEDVSLMAISDGQAPTFLHPNVTHLRHSGIEVGERTAHILIGMIKHNSDAMMDVRIRTTLVEMGSVADRTRVGQATRRTLIRSPRRHDPRHLPAVRAARRTARARPSRARLPRARARRSRRVRGLSDASLPRRRRQHAADLSRRARAARRAPLGRRRGREHRLHRARRRWADPPRSRGASDGGARRPRGTRARRGVLARRRRPAHRRSGGSCSARCASSATCSTAVGSSAAFSGGAVRRSPRRTDCSPRSARLEPARARATARRCSTPPASTSCGRDARRRSSCAPSVASARRDASSSRRSMALDTLMLELRVDPSRVAIGGRGRLRDARARDRGAASPSPCASRRRGAR